MGQPQRSSESIATSASGVSSSNSEYRLSPRSSKRSVGPQDPRMASREEAPNKRLRGRYKRRSFGSRGRPARELRPASAMDSSTRDRATGLKRIGLGRRPVEDLTVPSRTSVVDAEVEVLAEAASAMALLHAASSSAPAAAAILRRRSEAQP